MKREGLAEGEKLLLIAFSFFICQMFFVYIILVFRILPDFPRKSTNNFSISRDIEEL